MRWDPTLGHVLSIGADGTARCSCGVEGDAYTVGLHGQSVLESQAETALRDSPAAFRGADGTWYATYDEMVANRKEAKKI